MTVADLLDHVMGAARLIAVVALVMSVLGMRRDLRSVLRRSRTTDRGNTARADQAEDV